MRSGRWFLPESPDVVGLLRRQLAATIEGAELLGAWAAGDGAATEAIREAEHRGDIAKREVLEALHAAFVLPLEPEDVFTLSRGIDRILDYSRDLVSESKAMDVGPDAGIEKMAGFLVEAVGEIDRAITAFGENDAVAVTRAADAAIAAEGNLARAYYRGVAALLEVEQTRLRIGRRELYRRFLRVGEVVVEVAERVIYAVVKQT